MNPFLGGFVVDDNINAARIAITDSSGVGWGTAVETGYTVEMEVRRPNVQTLVATLSGTWEDANEAAALFYPGAEALLEPAAGIESQDYEGIIVLTKVNAVAKLGAGNNVDGIVPYQFKVRAWP